MKSYSKFPRLWLFVPLALLVVLSNAAGPQPPKNPTTPAEPSNRHFVTLRGEIVDWYCYIEKGLRGPGHAERAAILVAGPPQPLLDVAVPVDDLAAQGHEVAVGGFGGRGRI
ncbi:MAG TPA: hypothetical protein VFD83_01805, partial [Candidatus Polarisedimenticolia bacterium]|nr:hypothetical protein [Candidatus Polarisedimenticolia bacterium]